MMIAWYGLSTMVMLQASVHSSTVHGDSGPPPSADQIAATPTSPDWVLDSAEKARRAAGSVLGLTNGDANAIDLPLLEYPSEDDTPFLHAKVVTEPRWRVVVRDVRFEVKGEGGEPPRATRSFTLDVDLAPSDGHLIRVLSRWPEGVEPVAPRPNAQRSEEQLIAKGETWLRFAEAPPKRSLREVLSIIETAFGDVSTAQQIVVYNVEWSHPSRPAPELVWSVEFRGLPVVPETLGDAGGERKQLKPDQVNHLRHIVTDASGEWLRAGTSPQPDLSKSVIMQQPGKDDPNK